MANKCTNDVVYHDVLWKERVLFLSLALVYEGHWCDTTKIVFNVYASTEDIIDDTRNLLLMHA